MSARRRRNAEVRVDRRTRDWPDSLVEQVIARHCNASPNELAEKLSRLIGKPVLRQSITGWRHRGQFPPELIPAVHLLTGIPLAELIVRNRPRF